MAFSFPVTIARGVGPRTAAANVGLSPKQVVTLLKDDPQLQDALLDAQERQIEQVEEALFQSAKAGSLNAIKFYLTNLNDEKWRDTRATPPALPGSTTNVQINVPSLARQLAENPEASLAALDALVQDNSTPSASPPQLELSAPEDDSDKKD